jgi:hypothetical protein
VFGVDEKVGDGRSVDQEHFPLFGSKYAELLWVAIDKNIRFGV